MEWLHLCRCGWALRWPISGRTDLLKEKGQAQAREEGGTRRGREGHATGSPRETASNVVCRVQPCWGRVTVAISQASFTDDVSVQCLSVYRAVPRGK